MEAKKDNESTDQNDHSILYRVELKSENPGKLIVHPENGRNCGKTMQNANVLGTLASFYIDQHISLINLHKREARGR